MQPASSSMFHHICFWSVLSAPLWAIAAPPGGDVGDGANAATSAAGVAVVGAVMNPDGSPAAGVKVYLCRKVGDHTLLEFKNGEPRVDLPRVRDHIDETIADAAGRFSFPPTSDEFWLVTYGKQGFGQISRGEWEAKPEIALVPYGRIEGKALVHTKPAGGRTISAATRFGQCGEVQHLFEGVVTDSGKYALERIPPGYGQLGFQGQVHSSDGGAVSSATGYFLFIEVKPGETKPIDFGGFGRALVGQLKFADGLRDSRKTTASLSLQREGPKIPQDIEAQGREATEKWIEAWRHTSEGKRSQLAPNYYHAGLLANGSFRFDDVAPGSYRIIANVMTHGGIVMKQTSIESMVDRHRRYESGEIVMPAIPGGASEEPLNLGEVVLERMKGDENQPLAVGITAPAFEVKSLSGGTLKLEDFRGKYVLLDFWATWCGPCKRELPSLKKAYETYGREERLAFIGLSLDDKPEEAEAFVKQHDYPWIQGWIGPQKTSKVAEAYGVKGIPSLFLIGPDGKILANQLSAEAARGKLDQLFGKPQMRTGGPSGIVRAPDGKPAAGAVVYLVPTRRFATFQNGDWPSQYDMVSVGVQHGRTDDEGRFSFGPVKHSCTLIARHASGYGEVLKYGADDASGKGGGPNVPNYVDIANLTKPAGAADINLKVWSRIEGKAQIGPIPAEGSEIQLSRRPGKSGGSVIQDHYSTAVGKDGAFRFNQLPFGFYTISMVHPVEGVMGPARSTFTIYEQLDTGETKNVQVGGFGRAVVGRLTIPDVDRLDRDDIIASLVLHRRAPYPPALRGASSREKFAWKNKYHQTAEGKAALKMPSGYVLKSIHSNAFRIDDVVPGLYDVQLSIRYTEPGNIAAPGRPEGYYVKQFVEVPAADKGKPVEELDLGEIVLSLEARDYLAVRD